MKEHPSHKGYFVTKDGRVFSNKRGKLIEFKQSLNDKGYYIVRLNSNGKRLFKRVHRLVAETYIPNPDNLPHINHKDKNKINNNVSNLEWCDNQYNIEYSCSKWYEIKTPENEIIRVFNLRKFCRCNPVNRSNLLSQGKSKGYEIIKKEGF